MNQIFQCDYEIAIENINDYWGNYYKIITNHFKRTQKTLKNHFKTHRNYKEFIDIEK